MSKTLDTTGSSKPTTSVAQRGNIRHSLLSKKLGENLWIVDIGASDHVTGSIDTLSTYGACDRNINISVGNGIVSLAIGQGTAYLSNLKLKSVLYVPKLKCNLLSISKVTKDMNCGVTFFPFHCEFQDMTLGKMIGSATEKDGL